ncbi:thioredoxin-like protein [Lentinus tigrinus ALCF2SS1-7]|uniref:thioredoxin-like protein n=1 Tax=Lentinus tigrinus ALCF2SS1-7 TaxID=1328758 RepID=UPI0011663EB8|nr:thioredoxin-like protein [Lentinus tigrinus ALCF2SS1-7]
MASHPQRTVLYGAPTSPYVLRVRLALQEAGATYDPVYFDLDEKPSWFVEAVNPITGKVPALIYGGAADAPPEKPSADSVLLYESLVILEFIADLFPDAGLLPADPVQRAKARLFMSIVGEKIPSDNDLWITNEEDGSRLLQTLETLQGMLPDEGFVVGEWSIADAAFVPSLLFVNVFVKGGVGYWVKMKHGEKVKAELESSPRFARLRRYVDDWKKRPSLKAVWDEDIVIQKWLKRFAKNL